MVGAPLASDRPKGCCLPMAARPADENIVRQNATAFWTAPLAHGATPRRSAKADLSQSWSGRHWQATGRRAVVCQWRLDLPMSIRFDKTRQRFGRRRSRRRGNAPKIGQSRSESIMVGRHWQATGRRAVVCQWRLDLPIRTLFDKTRQRFGRRCSRRRGQRPEDRPKPI